MEKKVYNTRIQCNYIPKPRKAFLEQQALVVHCKVLLKLWRDNKPVVVAFQIIAV